jgi:hypothetical protein
MPLFCLALNPPLVLFVTMKPALSGGYTQGLCGALECLQDSTYLLHSCYLELHRLPFFLHSSLCNTGSVYTQLQVAWACGKGRCVVIVHVHIHVQQVRLSLEYTLQLSAQSTTLCWHFF